MRWLILMYLTQRKESMLVRNKGLPRKMNPAVKHLLLGDRGNNATESKEKLRKTKGICHHD